MHAHAARQVAAAAWAFFIAALEDAPASVEA